MTASHKTYEEWYESLPAKRAPFLAHIRGFKGLCKLCGGRGWYPGPCEHAVCTCTECKGKGWIK